MMTVIVKKRCQEFDAAAAGSHHSYMSLTQQHTMMNEHTTALHY